MLPLWYFYYVFSQILDSYIVSNFDLHSNAIHVFFYYYYVAVLFINYYILLLFHFILWIALSLLLLYLLLCSLCNPCAENLFAFRFSFVFIALRTLLLLSIGESDHFLVYLYFLCSLCSISLLFIFLYRKFQFNKIHVYVNFNLICKIECLFEFLLFLEP